MNKELYVSSTPHETRLAVSENGEIAEIYIEREKEYSLAGSIYKGRVTRVLPGMQSSFVDIGLERDAFLYVSDFFEDSEEYDRVVSEAENAVARLEPGAAPAAPASVPGPEVEAGAGEPAAAPPREGGRDDDRRGGRRGRHRGRRGRAGIPDEKFARVDDLEAAPAASGPEGEPAYAAGLSEPTWEAAPEAAPAPALAALVLPGESLAKYRGAPPAPAAAPRPPAAAAPAPPPPPPPPPSVAPAVAATPVVPVAAAALVLPGESLAKYRHAPPPAAPAFDVADEPSAEEITREEFEHERSQPDSPLEFRAPAEADAEAESLQDEEDLEIGAEAEEVAEGGNAEAAVRADSGEARMQAPAREARGEGEGRRGRRRRGRGRRGEHPEGGDGGDRPSEGARAPEAAASRPGREGGRPPREGREGGKNESSRLISDLLHAGQEILVQISKEPLGKKGARITSHLALPGRFLVYMPTTHHIGVSRKISSDEERARLKRLLLEHTKDMPGGFIVRTAGAGASDEEIVADIRLLSNQWNDLRQQFEEKRSPALLHHDLNLVERTLRDQLSSDFTHIWVDTDEQYQRVVKFVSYFMPHLTDRVRLYTREEPLFEHFGIQQEINNSLKSKVWLKSGGYIVLNQTEALVAIDINTGKYVGRSNRLEDTIVKTNVEAIQEIVRQIRLRDLGGIIVIDFIDMDERKNRQKVMQALEDAMRADRAPSKILSFNDFGLVALTRKRVKQSLERTLGSPCPYCDGVGLVKSPITVCNEIYSEVKKLAPTLERDDVVLRVNPEVAKVLKGQGAQRLREMEDATRKALSVRPDPQVHQEQFEIY